MMKILAVLMVICFVGLSYLSIAASNCGEHTEQEISAEKDHHPHEEAEEDCATSCLSYCCSSTVILQELTYAHVSTPVYETQESPPYYKFYCIEPSFSIWQPPKSA
ncbi:hypothetical protein [Pedobacter gandavensis]|uniref:hypothetical protein n=1 Tax=Pedobacter gandavensis TaxID=2679963 RepID=UPI00292F2569|nr:hypothetical protein [Pedobacter gandavensis]